MTKQEAIQRAWGENWEIVQDKCDDNGFVPFWTFLNPGKIHIDIRYVGRSKFIRPESLKGLNDNNGWTKIESENDLPKDNDAYFVAYSDGSVEHFLTGSWIRTFKELESNPEYPPKRILTHYQPIQKPKPPIY